MEQLKEKTAYFNQSINDVHQVVFAENAEKIKPLTKHNADSYTQAIKDPKKVFYAGLHFKPKGEVLYRGESFTHFHLDLISRSFEITNTEQEVTHGDLFAFKGLKIDDAFGFAMSEAAKRVFKGKQIYEIRLDFMFRVCYTLEINKNRMYVGVTLADEHELNDKLSMDERMFIELACNLTYGYFAKLNNLPNPLTEEEILAIQKEYEAINKNFINNETESALSGEWDPVRHYEVVERDAESGKIIDVQQFKK